MNRLVIVAAVAVGLPVLLFGALLVLIANPETFREEIEQGFGSATGWELDMGTMRWRYFPPVSLELAGVSIENAGPLAELSHASIDLALLPLVFGGNLELQGVTVDGLKLNLVQRADGSNNWTPAATAEQSSALAGDESAPEDPGSGPDQLRVNNISITNIALAYTDEAAVSRTEATLDELRATGIGFGTPFEVSFGGRIDQSESFRLASSGRARLKLASGFTHIGIEELEIGNEVVLEGMPAIRSTLSLTGEVALNEGRASVVQLALTIPGGRVEGSVEVTNLNTDPALSGNWSVALNPRETLQAVGSGDVLPPGTALSSLRLGSEISGSATNVQLKNLEGALDGTRIAGSAGVLLAGAVPAVTFELDVGELDLSDLAADQSAAEDSATAASAGTPEPMADSEIIPVELLQDINVDGRVRIAAIKVAELEAEALDFAVILNNARLTSTFAARAYGGSIDWQAKVSSDTRTTTRLDAHVVGVDLTALAGTEWVTGTLTLDTALSMDGTMLSEVLGSIDGSSRFDVADGTLDVTPVKSAADAVDSLRGQPSGIAAWPDTIAFTSLSGTHTFQQGAKEDQVLEFALETLRGRGEGGFDLLADTVDYDLYIVLEDNPDSQLAVDESITGIRWPLACEGPLSEPASLCRPDGAGLRRMVSDIAKKEISGKAREKLLEKLPDDVKGKARDVLKGLFR